MIFSMHTKKLEDNHARLAALRDRKTASLFDVDGAPVEDLTLLGEEIRLCDALKIHVDAMQREDPAQGQLF